MQKEILTREKIEKEIRSKGIEEIKVWGFADAFMVLIFVIILNMFRALFERGDNIIFAVFLTVIYVVLVCICIYNTVQIFKKLKPEAIKITIDKLVDIREQEDPGMAFGFLFGFRLRHILYRPYCLYFAAYGRYVIPQGKNYKWSEMFCMDNRGVYNYSKIREDFYLAVKGKKIILAYNTRLFEMKE